MFVLKCSIAWTLYGIQKFLYLAAWITCICRYPETECYALLYSRFHFVPAILALANVDNATGLLSRLSILHAKYI